MYEQAVKVFKKTHPERCWLFEIVHKEKSNFTPETHELQWTWQTQSSASSRCALWGKTSSVCREAQTSAFGSREWVLRQGKRGETAKTSHILLPVRPESNWWHHLSWTIVCLFCILKTEVTGTSAELRIHPNQSSGTSEGFPWDNRGFWWVYDPSQCWCWGKHHPAFLSLAVWSITHCGAHREGDPPLSLPEIVSMLTQDVPSEQGLLGQPFFLPTWTPKAPEPSSQWGFPLPCPQDDGFSLAHLWPALLSLPHHLLLSDPPTVPSPLRLLQSCIRKIIK